MRANRPSARKALRVARLRAHRRLLAAAGVTAAIGFGAGAYAQDQQNDQAPLAEVVVTGSHIRQTDQGALPVQSITQEQIQRTGAVNAEQFLQSVSIAVQGNSNTVAATASGANTGSISSVSLRGLGSQRTLVLINGRRVAGGGNIVDSTTVDVNMIPLSVLQRVDVEKDSASAVYGSDAIAGVINFIVRDNYQGYELTGYGGGTSDGGGDIKRISAMAGFGDLTRDRFNVLFAANFDKENPLFGAQRGFASSGINVGAANDTTSGNTFPANFTSLDNSIPTTVNPQAGNCSPSVTDPLIHPATRCRFDPASLVSLLPNTQRYNLFAAGHFALTPDVQLYGEASYSQRRVRVLIQPVPLSDQFAMPLNNPLASNPLYQNGQCGAVCSTVLLAPSSPYYPTALVKSLTGGATPVLDVFYRSTLSGNRDLTDSSGQPRAVFGIQGTAAGWDFNADLLYSQTQLTEYDNGGYPLYSKVLPLLNSGVVNFFGPTPASVVSQIQATNYMGPAYKTTTTLTEFEAFGSRQIFTLPAGPVQMAIDGSFRKEKFSVDPSAALQAGDLSGYGGNNLPEDAQRNVFGASLEFHVPIVGSLSASPAVRYDHYEGVGGKTTPKIGLRWKPLDELLVRGSYSRGFRAPSLTELYQPQTNGVSANGLTDPARCIPANTNSGSDCGTQFNILIGGTPTLKPETSDTYTLGFVVEPVRNLSVGLDAFSIKLQNTIIFGIDVQTILNDPQLYGNLVTRGAPTPATCAGCPGPVNSINQLNSNFGETDTKGYDVDVRYRTPITPVGTFSFGIVGSYFATYRIEQPDHTFLNQAGVRSPITNGNGGLIPRWHHYATVTWAKGPFEVAASQNFQSSYADVPSSCFSNGNCNVPGFASHEVASYSTVDLQTAYSGIPHTKIAIGARNLLNKDPPYTNAGGQDFFQAGYDPGYADPRGRFVYGTVTYSFGK